MNQWLQKIVQWLVLMAAIAHLAGEGDIHILPINIINENHTVQKKKNGSTPNRVGNCYHAAHC